MNSTISTDEVDDHRDEAALRRREVHARRQRDRRLRVRALRAPLGRGLALRRRRAAVGFAARRTGVVVVVLVVVVVAVVGRRRAAAS